jgi:hypothetical protein
LGIIFTLEKSTSMFILLFLNRMLWILFLKSSGFIPWKSGPNRNSLKPLVDNGLVIRFLGVSYKSGTAEGVRSNLAHTIESGWSRLDSHQSEWVCDSSNRIPDPRLETIHAMDRVHTTSSKGDGRIEWTKGIHGFIMSTTPSRSNGWNSSSTLPQSRCAGARALAAAPHRCTLSSILEP